LTNDKHPLCAYVLIYIYKIKYYKIFKLKIITFISQLAINLKETFALHRKIKCY